ncbi:MAG: glycine cleavage system aminomethyltransferase GcvT [Candidatus Caldatribacteriota bacterium]|nr:glycine cleavage system aminomethyltransferase GcvT [Candidatus Caldatribacteriota bacterium]
MEENNLLLTPLHEEHLKLNARMIPFDGFDMPVQYSGIIDEHNAVREKVGIFDVSHMGEIEIKGEDALSFASYLVTNSLSKMKNGDIKYSPLCYHHGGQVDDLFVYKVKDDFILLVVNASPEFSIKDYEWILKNKGQFKVKITNKSRDYGEVALQGPNAIKILDTLVKVEIPLTELKRFKFTFAELFGKKILISRTGYTGEDGYEIYTLKSEDVKDIWNGLLKEGEKWGIKPCGLGARDTTRFEVCYWLYGNDIDETVNPLESGQGWTVKFSKDDFIGKDALLKIKEKGITRKMVGLSIPHGGIPRSKMEVWKADKKIGYITSGNYCPSLKSVNALAIIDLPFTKNGTLVEVMIRNRKVNAVVTEIPFLQPFNKR